MSSRSPQSRTKLSAEHGFTLMETLVAMVTGVIVTGALFAILDFSLSEQTRITDRTQADQLGRVAMSNVVDELHSSCTGARPIQASSDATNLWFISTYGAEGSGEPEITNVFEHHINWTAETTSSTGQHLGKLIDYSFKSESGNSQEGWKFPSKATKTRTIAKDVFLPSGSLFSYYKYGSTYQLTSIPSSELPLTAKAAENVAEVAVGFAQAPEDENTKTGETVSLNDAVVMRLDPTTSEEVTPCE